MAVELSEGTDSLRNRWISEKKNHPSCPLIQNTSFCSRARFESTWFWIFFISFVSKHSNAQKKQESSDLFSKIEKIDFRKKRTLPLKFKEGEISEHNL